MTNFDLVPIELKQYRQWLCWKFGPPDIKTKKRRKIPINPHTGENAKCNDQTTWGSFREAEAAIKRLSCDGLGFVFTSSDAYCGIDIDNCWNSTTNTLSQEAAELIYSINSYAEISPSGTGVKLFFRANLVGAGIKRPNIEIYSQGRYFTVTGLHFAGTPVTINEAQEVVDQLCAKHRTPTPDKSGSTQDDQRLRPWRGISDGDLLATVIDWIV